MILRTVKSGSDGNGYILDDGDRSLILDAGVRFLDVKRAVQFNYSGIQGCLVTHIHGDHIKYAKEYTKAGIKVFSNHETVERYGNGVKPLEEKRKYKIGSFTATPFYVPHVSATDEGLENCPNFAYLINSDGLGTMLYATDFEYLPYTFQSIRLNHILIECNHIDRMVNKDKANFEHVVRGHASLHTVMEIIRQSVTTDLSTVILCHLSSQNADAEEMINAVKTVSGAGVRVYVAEAGHSIELSTIPF